MVYGEGEWKVRQQDWSSRRIWRKLHLGVNEATGDRTLANQKVESRIGCAILNQMIHLGKPDSWKVEKIN